MRKLQLINWVMYFSFNMLKEVSETQNNNYVLYILWITFKTCFFFISFSRVHTAPLFVFFKSKLNTVILKRECGNVT